MANINIYPSTTTQTFTTATQDVLLKGVNSGLMLYNADTGSTERFSISGSTGTVFSVSDSQTGLLWSVNDIAATPIAEIYSDARVEFAEDVNFKATNMILTPSPTFDHKASGLIIPLTSAVAVNFGDVCYINSSGSTSLIDADAIGTMSGIVMCADESIAAAGSGNFLMYGVARNDAWAWTVGGLIFGTVTGTTGNTLSQTAPSGTGDVVQVLGVATHADRMLFTPSLSQVEIL